MSVSLLFLNAQEGARTGLQGIKKDSSKTFYFRDLQANRDGNIVEIKWSTAFENNSDYFIVQRSANDNVFTDVVQALATGNSDGIEIYTSEDYDPYEGESFYRIVQVNSDGTSFHSPSVKIKTLYEPEIAVYPNPTRGPIQLYMKVKAGDEVMIIVRDVFGKEYYSNVIITSDDEEVFVIDPEQKIAPGMYVVVASSQDYMYEKKIVVQ